MTSPVGTTSSPSIGKNFLENQGLGRDAFLKLLIVQLQNQDPLNPVQNEDFVAQLAQFSSLQELQSINQTLSADRNAEATAGILQAVDSNTAVALIGKEVEIPLDTITYTGDGAVEIGYHLEEPAARVTLRIFDSEDHEICTLTETDPTIGNASLLWNGKDAEGRNVPAGKYHIVPSAVDGQDDPVNIFAALTGTVIGIRYEDGSPILVLEGGEAPLSGVSRISQRS